MLRAARARTFRRRALDKAADDMIQTPGPVQTARPMARTTRLSLSAGRTAAVIAALVLVACGGGGGGGGGTGAGGTGSSGGGTGGGTGGGSAAAAPSR